jgi:hypothetical protein
MNFLTVLIIISGLSSNPNDRLNLLAETLFTQYEINFNINQYEIYKRDYNPEWRGNFEGGGVYIYESYTIYFNNIVGYYKDIFIDQICKETFPNRIVFNNPSADSKDVQYLQNCFGKGIIKMHDNIDEEYYKKETHEYKTNKYKMIFVIESGEILKLEIQKI